MVIEANTRPKRVEGNTPRVDFVNQDFNDLIEDQGAWVKVTPSMICPNKNTLDGTDHTFNCPLCGGRQFYDVDSHSYEDWAILQSITSKEDYEDKGIYLLKDLKMTINSSRRLWVNYKVEILDQTSVFNEMVERKRDRDKLRYIPHIAATDTPIIIIDREANGYFLTTDYTIDGKDIVWNENKGPAINSIFSVIYPVLPTFRVVGFIHENRYYYDDENLDHKVPIQLPQCITLRFDFFDPQAGMNEEFPLK